MADVVGVLTGTMVVRGARVVLGLAAMLVTEALPLVLVAPGATAM
jgi:hypothetical protein